MVSNPEGLWVSTKARTMRMKTHVDFKSDEGDMVVYNDDTSSFPKPVNRLTGFLQNCFIFLLN
jgi:hypothetical protein